MEYIIAALVTTTLVVGIINVVIFQENKILEAENKDLLQALKYAQADLDKAAENDGRGPDGRYTGKR